MCFDHDEKWINLKSQQARWNLIIRLRETRLSLISMLMQRVKMFQRIDTSLT